MDNYLKLVSLMHKYKEQKIWEKIDSRDIFQVELENKDVFISVLGKANIEYGLIVYESYEDLSRQTITENDSIDIEQPDYAFHLTSIKVDCRDGQLIEENDFSGKIFEYDIHDECIAVKYTEGKPMRLVNDEECLLLIELLELLIRYSEEIKCLDFDILDYTQTYSLKENRGLEISIISFIDPLFPHYDISYEFHPDMLEEVGDLNRQDEWAIGIFYSLAYIEENEDAYFPKICYIYNITKDYLLEMLFPYKEDYEQFPILLLQTFLKIGYLPEYLYLANYETLCYFAYLLDQLKIDGEVKMRKELVDLYDEMTQYLIEDNQKENFVS